MEMNDLLKGIRELLSKVDESEQLKKKLCSLQITYNITYSRLIISYFCDKLNENYNHITDKLVESNVYDKLNSLIQNGETAKYFEFDCNGTLLNVDNGRRIENLDNFIEMLKNID